MKLDSQPQSAMRCATELCGPEAKMTPNTSGACVILVLWPAMSLNSCFLIYIAAVAGLIPQVWALGHIQSDGAKDLPSKELINRINQTCTWLHASVSVWLPSTLTECYLSYLYASIDIFLCTSGNNLLCSVIFYQSLIIQYIQVAKIF